MELARRTVLQAMGVAGGACLAAPGEARITRRGDVVGRLTGAAVIAEVLAQHGVGCVFGIPGAKENELWDEFKERNIPYLLTAHEFGAACMADGYARATGKPGVLCVVPGPGVTNALTGLGEALLDSTPMVAIVGDVSNAPNARPFQVHSLDTVALLKPVTKCVTLVADVHELPEAIQRAFAVAVSGEPGPVAVVVPFNLLFDVGSFRVNPPTVPAVPFDSTAFDKAAALLADPHARIGIYAGLGCMNACAGLAAVAELLQAPVATSVSGKGVIPECFPLAVGWGFGPHATTTAEHAFAQVNTLLAIGVKFSEVSTGFYGNPNITRVIHVDANAANLGKVIRTDVCVHSDAELFLAKLLERCKLLQRPSNPKLLQQIAGWKCDSEKLAARAGCQAHGLDPLAVVLALRKALADDAVLCTDVSLSEHLAAEHYTVKRPRTYLNPVDNQSMGWSLPAAIGAQRAYPTRTVAALIGDGCLLMSMVELSTAARAKLPVKVFLLDDQAYRYMQELQNAAYHRTTATLLAKLDYRSLAHGFGVAYSEVTRLDQLDCAIAGALLHDGPVLVRIQADYGDRKIRWIEAVRKKFTRELNVQQKARFLARATSRAVQLRARND